MGKTKESSPCLPEVHVIWSDQKDRGTVLLSFEDREKYGQLSEDAGELISKYCKVDFKKYSDEEVIPMGSVSENFQKIFIRFLFVVKRTINN